MIGKGLGNTINREAFYRHAKVRDRRLRVRAPLSQTDVLWTGANAQAGGYILSMLDRQPEQALVKLDRTFAIRNCERHVAERAHPNRRLVRLRISRSP